MKILLCTKRDSFLVDLLASQLSDCQIIACSTDTAIEHLDGVDVIIPYFATIDALMINSGKFGLIQQFGVGLDAVNIEAATHAGVWVARVPGKISGNADSVAEYAIMLMLMLSRPITIVRPRLNSNKWSQQKSIALFKKTACIVGLGDIGTALAVRLKAFGMRLVAVRQHSERGASPETGIERVYGADALTEALSDADYVILCAYYQKNNHHLINSVTLAAMKPGAFLINVARGGLVDTDALSAALARGHLAGAGLDLVDSPTDALFQHNVIVTPHIAGVTDLADQGITAVVVDNIKRYIRGEQPLYAVNAPDHLRRLL